jgi:hypothetical protein
VIKDHSLRKQLEGIQKLLDATPQATGGDLELQSHWGRYLCVLTAGFLENALYSVYSRYAHAGANPAVANFAAAQLDDISNPKAKRFVETAGMFKKEWSDALEIFLADDGRKDAVDSIMRNRHQIAHGEYSGITISKVKQYLDRCEAVVEFIEQQCGL